MCLSLANHNRSFEVHVEDNKELLITWLKEKMLDVTEQNICSTSGGRSFTEDGLNPTNFLSRRRRIPKPILVDLDFTW